MFFEEEEEIGAIYDKALSLQVYPTGTNGLIINLFQPSLERKNLHYA